MSNLIDGEVTQKQTKRPALWRRFLAAYDGQGRWSGVVQWVVFIAIAAPAFLWRPWFFIVIAASFGFAFGWWTARKHWLRDGEVPPL